MRQFSLFRSDLSLETGTVKFPFIKFPIPLIRIDARREVIFDIETHSAQSFIRILTKSGTVHEANIRTIVTGKVIIAGRPTVHGWIDLSIVSRSTNL